MIEFFQTAGFGMVAIVILVLAAYLFSLFMSLLRDPAFLVALAGAMAVFWLIGRTLRILFHM